MSTAQQRAIVKRQFQEHSCLKKRQLEQTFSSFSVQEGQEAAYEAAKVYAQRCQLKGFHEGLLLVGPVGCGKTHLAAAIINDVLDNWNMSPERINDACEYSYTNTRYNDNPPDMALVSVVSMLETLRSTYNNDKSPRDMLGAYARVRVLILDDLGTERMTDWALERLFEVIDHRYCEELPTVITSNLPPALLKQAVGDRIFDRIRSMCLMVPMTAPSQRPTAGAVDEQKE